MVDFNEKPEIFMYRAKDKFRPPGKCDIYYEQKLKEVFYEAANNPEGTIYNEQQWNTLIALILRSKLGSFNDTDRIDHVRPAFPLSFETFINTIQQEFGD
jgi:hypothetical protein